MRLLVFLLLTATAHADLLLENVDVEYSNNDRGLRVGWKTFKLPRTTTTTDAVLDTVAGTITYGAVSMTIPGYSDNGIKRYLISPEVCDGSGCTPPVYEDYVARYASPEFTIDIGPLVFAVERFTPTELEVGDLISGTITGPSTIQASWSITGPTESASGMVDIAVIPDDYWFTITRVTRDPPEVGPIVSWDQREVSLWQPLTTYKQTVQIDGRGFRVTAIPEPSQWLVFLIGTAVCALRNRLLWQAGQHRRQ